MNRQDLRRLMDVRGYPAVSILCRTHRTFPDNRQDPIRLKNLLSEADRRLQVEFTAREVRPLQRRLEQLAASIDHAHNLDGLALFANAEVGELHRVPFPVEDRVVIDETFATRDLLHAFNRSDPYRVLLLSERDNRLFDGVRDELSEVSDGRFPLSFDPVTPEPPPLADRGMDDSAPAEERRRQILRDVDGALGELQHAESLPIVLVGGVRAVAMYSELSRFGDDIIGTIPAHHDSPTPHDLGKRTWPVVQAWIESRNAAVLEELERAVGAGRFVSTVEGAWRKVRGGRGGTLLVEEGFRYPVRVADDGWSVSPAADATAPDVIDDAVDELIEDVIAQGGRAVVLPDGMLADHGRLSLLLRY